jgi:uncharacterized protein YjbI with pentapeptide repeats
METKSRQNKSKVRLFYKKTVEMPFAVLEGADLHNLNLVGANFCKANLSNVNFEGSELHHANFADADLNGANLKGADIVFANLKNAKMKGCKIDREWDYKLSDEQKNQVEWLEFRE